MSSGVADGAVVTTRPDGPGPAHGGAAPPRRPFLSVALALLGLVAAVLVGAYVLDRQFRRPVGVEPAPPIAAKAEPTTAPAARVAPTIAQPTAAPTVTTAPTATAVPTLAPPTTIAPAAAAGAPVPAQGTAQPPPRAADLVTPLQKELLDAYLRYWDIRMRAYYDLDTSRLHEVMAGAELARETQQVLDLRAQGRAVSTDIEHNIQFVKATPDEAVLYDEYVNHSLYMDPVTKREFPTKETPPIEKVSYEFKKVDGVWKVVDGTRHV